MAVPPTIVDYPRPSSLSQSLDPSRQGGTTSTDTRNQRLRVVGKISASVSASPSIHLDHSSQRDPQQGARSNTSAALRSSPPLLHRHDSSPDMHLSSLQANRRSHMTAIASTDGFGHSSRPSMHLLDPDTVVQASNPAHPDHHLWLQRNRISSPTSRRKRVPLLDYEDTALTDSSAGPSGTSHEAVKGPKAQGQGALSTLLPSLQGPGRSRPSSSVASPSSSSDEALSRSRPNTPSSRKRVGNQSPLPRRVDGQGQAASGSSSEARAAAFKRRRERRERKKALATPPPPPLLPPRISSTQPVRDDDHVEGLPPLERAVYPLPTIPQSPPPSKPPNLIGHRSSSNAAPRDSAQHKESQPLIPPLPPPKAVRLLGADPVTFPGDDDGDGYPNFARPEFRGLEQPRFRSGRSASLDLLRESLNFFPPRSTSQTFSQKSHQLMPPPPPSSEKSGPSRIRASFDAVRPRLMFGRSNTATLAPDLDVDSDTSEAAAVDQRPEGKMRKGLRSIRSVLRLRGEMAAPTMSTSKSVSDDLAPHNSGRIARSTRSMDVLRDPTTFVQANGRLIHPLPPTANHRQLGGRSASHQRLSLVGEEMDMPTIDHASAEFLGSSETPSAFDVHAYTPRSISPIFLDSRRPSTSRPAPQLQTVMEISHESPAAQTRVLSKAGGQQGQPSQSHPRWLGEGHQRSVTEGSEVSSTADSVRTTNRVKHLPSLASLRSLPNSAKSSLSTVPGRETAQHSASLSPFKAQTFGFSKGRKGLFTSLWSRTSSAPGFGTDQPPGAWPVSELGPGTSAGSFGSTVPTLQSSASAGSSLRSTLEGVYGTSHEPPEANDPHLGKNTSRQYYHPYSNADLSSMMLGLGIGNSNVNRAAKPQGEGRAAAAGGLSDAFSIDDWPPAEKSNSASMTPKLGRSEGLHDGMTSFAAENVEQQAVTIPTGHVVPSHPKPRVAFPASPSVEPKGRGKSKRSPFLEVVAAGRKSFSRDRSRQASSDADLKPPPPESSGAPTIHKSLGPMLLSEASFSSVSAPIGAARKGQHLVDEDEDEPWDGMDVEDGTAMHSSTSFNALRPTTGERVPLTKEASAPSWDSISCRHSPPSPSTSPSASPSSRQRDKSNSDTNNPLLLVKTELVSSMVPDAKGQTPVFEPPGSINAKDSSSPPTSSPPASSPQSPSLSLGEQSQRSFGGRRASQGRHANPPASLRLSPSMQEVLTTPPLPPKDDRGMTSATTGPSSSRSFKTALSSPGTMKGWRSISATPKSSTGMSLIVNEPAGASAATMKKSDSVPIKGRTSFSMDRDRSPVASPYVNHAAGSATLGQGVKSAFKKLGLSSSFVSSSQSTQSLGGTMASKATNTPGSGHMKEGISSDSYLFSPDPSLDEDQERLPSPLREIPSSRPRPSAAARQWSSFGRSASSGNLASHDSSLAAARAATQMLQAQMEDLLPTPTATPLTSTAPGKLPSTPVSPFLLGRPSIDSEIIRGEVGDKSDRTAAADHARSIGNTYGYNAQGVAAATAPPRPPRNRSALTAEEWSPGPAQFQRSEGASSSSSSYATPTSARTHDCDDLPGFDAMLRAQKVREEEMFKEIAARSRSRSKEGVAVAAPALGSIFSSRTSYSRTGGGNSHGNEYGSPQRLAAAPHSTGAHGAGGKGSPASSSSPQQNRDGFSSHSTTKSGRAPFLLSSKS